MNKFLIAALSFGLFPVMAPAWSGYNSVTITHLSVYQAGQASPAGVLVEVSPVTPADTEGCSQSGKGWIWIDFSSTAQPDGKTLYAMLVAAELAGKTVNIGVNGCASNGLPLAYASGVYP